MNGQLFTTHCLNSSSKTYDGDPAVKVDGTMLTGGFIALQAETAPADFRKVELLNLEGCTDPAASNYKSYFVKSNPGACRR